MTADAGEIFRDLIAEYETAQTIREQSDHPTPHCVGQFWMNGNQLHISALGADGKTIVWLPVGAPEPKDGSPGLWI